MTTPPKCEDLYLKIAELERRESDLMEKIARAGRVSFSFFEERDALQQRLTVAEQRAVELSKALELVADGGFDPDSGSGSWGAVRITLEDWHIIKAALKPAAEWEGS